MPNDLGAAGGPEAPNQAQAERGLGRNDFTTGRFGGPCKEPHEFAVRVSWRGWIVDREEINPDSIRGQKRQSQAEKVRGSLCVRAAQSGRDSANTRIFQAGSEQADPVQIFGKLRANPERHLAAGNL